LRVGIVPKFGSAEALRLAEKILDYSRGKGIDVYLDWRASRLIKWDKTFILGQLDLDFIIVIGGDGTVLNTLHLLGDVTIPIITIRYGKRGFLCDVAPFEYKEVIDRLVREEYRLVDYMMLTGILRGKKLPYVLNDYVITTGGVMRAKVARVSIFKNNEPIYYLVGDGVIVSPPVGSTAYSLSAGGPVVDPEMHAIIVTPLAPVTLCSRSVVLPPDTQITVRVNPDSPDLILIADGDFIYRISPGEEIKIFRAPKPARFARFYYGEFYVRLFQRCM
jgi:NAD+ kinase